ncbi:hypothetical protein D3C76_1596580 [compost metagenome]
MDLAVGDADFHLVCQDHSHRMVVLGKYRCGLRLHRHALCHQRQQSAGVGPFGVVAQEVRIDVSKQGVQPGLALGRLVLDDVHEPGVHEPGQST